MTKQNAPRLDQIVGADTRSPSMESMAKDLFGTTKAELFPSFNPLIDITLKWAEFGSGSNPRDAHFGSDIVPPTEWEAQGWPATKAMLSWTTDKFGVVSTIAHSFTEPYIGNPFESPDETTVETISRTTPGLSKLIRFSDRGLSENQWADIEAEEMEAARFRLGLPEEVRKSTKHLYRLRRRVGELAAREATEKALLSKWYGAAYLPLTRKMKESEGDAKAAARKELIDATAHMEQRYLPVVATEKAKIAVLGSGQPEHKKENGNVAEPDSDYQARLDVWTAERAAAEQWLKRNKNVPAVREVLDQLKDSKPYKDAIGTPPKLRIGKVDPTFAKRRNAYWEKRNNAEKLLGNLAE